ncbi:hypothetical protein ACFQ51_51640 [Streptomyces kaempferi]
MDVVVVLGQGPVERKPAVPGQRLATAVPVCLQVERSQVRGQRLAEVAFGGGELSLGDRRWHLRFRADVFGVLPEHGLQTLDRLRRV